MGVILNNFSVQLARCMLNFRDAGIKKQEPLFLDLMKKIRVPYQYFQSVQCCPWKG